MKRIYQKKRTLFAFALLSLAWLCTNRCAAQAADSAKIVSSITRCWRAFSHEYTTIYGLEEEEIQRYSKQKVCFAADSVSMYYGVRHAPRYSVKKVNAEDYSKSNFDCDKQKLGIAGDSLFVVTISSLTRPGKNGIVHKMTDVVAFDGECIYAVVDGVIFRLIDADSKTQPRSAN